MRLVCQCPSSLVSGKRLSLLARIPNSIRLRIPNYSDSFKWLDPTYRNNAVQCTCGAPVGQAYGLMLRLMHLYITGNAKAAYLQPRTAETLGLGGGLADPLPCPPWSVADQYVRDRPQKQGCQVGVHFCVYCCDNKCLPGSEPMHCAVTRWWSKRLPTFLGSSNCKEELGAWSLDSGQPQLQCLWAGGDVCSPPAAVSVHSTPRLGLGLGLGLVWTGTTFCNASRAPEHHPDIDRTSTGQHPLLPPPLSAPYAPNVIPRDVWIS